MSNKHKYHEEDAKNRFLTHLARERGEEWRLLQESYLVDPQTGRDFDYQLGLGDRRIALEIVRLTQDGDEMARRNTYNEIIPAIWEELERRGVTDLRLRTPSSFNVSKSNREQFVREKADKLELAARSCTDVEGVRVDGFTVYRAQGLGGIIAASTGRYGAYDAVDAAQVTLERKLRDKNSQLDVASHERIVLILGWNEFVGIDDVRQAVSCLDLSCLPNIDKIYFESERERIDLAYERGEDVAVTG